MTNRSGVQGAVLWITGYSAAGKTTIGREVTRLLVEDGLPAFFLDGDQLRAIFAHKWGYSLSERVELASTYFRLCSHLAKQGAVVVISAVAMFDEARHWFRQNIENGFEVYLRVPLAERLLRDSRTKRIYKSGMVGMESYIEPTDADIVIDNFGETDAEAAARKVVAVFQKRTHRITADHGRSEHWDGFYHREAGVRLPSPFARYCLTRMSTEQRVLEIGCGNGRDASFFADHGFKLTAIDKSPAAIEASNASNSGENINYVCCDATDVFHYVAGQFGTIYSRFSLHAITRAEEDVVLAAAFDLLLPNGLLCIECRSINDPMARQGDVLSPTERISGHYRRFVVLTELVDKLKEIGFTILEETESAGLAVFGDEDPVVIRILATKR